nr:MAG TPA: hypothetical protein [Bacteriophage sp.]
MDCFSYLCHVKFFGHFVLKFWTFCFADYTTAKDFHFDRTFVLSRRKRGLGVGKDERKFRQCAPFFGKCLRKSCTGVRRFGKGGLLRSL